MLDHPPSYTVIPDFLGGNNVRRLLKFAQTHKDEFGLGEVVDGDSSKFDDSRRVSLILPKIGEYKTIVVERTRKALPGIFEALDCRPFEPARFETEMAAHSDGAFFSRHIDLLVNPAKADTQRVLSMVYYFHKLPPPFSGGILRLYSLADKGGVHVDVEPVCDSAVFFPSWFPHEVLRINCPSASFADSRFAINCWIHKKI